MTLSKPSVSYRRTINTIDSEGRPVAVNAQHYAVLVTDVEEWAGEEDVELPKQASRLGLGAGAPGGLCPASQLAQRVV
jgi:hypothetical protein